MQDKHSPMTELVVKSFDTASDPGSDVGMPAQKKPGQDLLAAANPLIVAATKIFSAITRLNPEKNHYDVDKLKNFLSTHLQQFSKEALHLNYMPESISLCEYVLAHAIDHKIEHSDWGKMVHWHEHRITKSLAHHQALEIEFSAVLRKMCVLPGTFIDILEFVFICRSFSDYSQSSETSLNITEDQSLVYSVIRNQRGEFDKRLSPKHQRIEPKKNVTPFSFKTFKFLLMIAALFIFMGYCGYQYFLHKDQVALDQNLVTLQQTLSSSTTPQQTLE